MERQAGWLVHLNQCLASTGYPSKVGQAYSDISMDIAWCGT